MSHQHDEETEIAKSLNNTDIIVSLALGIFSLMLFFIVGIAKSGSIELLVFVGFISAIIAIIIALAAFFRTVKLGIKETILTFPGVALGVVALLLHIGVVMYAMETVMYMCHQGPC